MFDAVRNNRRIVQVFLAAITIPFAFWGLDSYFRDGGGAGAVATIGSVSISEAELTENLMNRRETMRAEMGASFDQAATEQPAFKQAVLDSLIVRKTLLKRVTDAQLGAADSQLQYYIQHNFPEFQENGKFSLERYQTMLRSNGKSELAFERDARQDIALRSLISPIVKSAVAPTPVVERWLQLQDEARVVAELPLLAKDFEKGVKLDEAAAKTYYEANKSRFETPEQLKVEYAELSTEALSRTLEVSDADARKWYEDHLDKYREPEERRASHILIESSGTSEEAAKAKAEAVLAKLKADPAGFAKLAKAESSDKVSAEQGGDLGFFGRGSMVKPFEDAVFALKPDETSALVKTDFGYHIIRLTEIRGGKAKPFEAAKAEILEELRKTQGAKKFAESAELFSNIVYEQADSFKPVEQKLPVKVVATDWVAKGAKLPGSLGNEKVRAAYQGSEAIKSRRNSEAIDIGNGSLVSVRVIDHKPAAQRPFEDVKAQIEKELLTVEAQKLAKTEGEARLAKLNAGETVAASWAPTKSVKRADGSLPAEAQKVIFSAKADKLPTYVGVASSAGYSIYRLDKVTTPVLDAADGRVASLRSSYAQAMADADLRAMIKGLRERYGVKILTNFESKSVE